MDEKETLLTKIWGWAEDGGWRYLVFALYLISTAIIAGQHAPWRDEGQAWVIARDFNPWQIIRQMPYEGTPPLWHFLLFPFAAAGLPYGCMFVINYLLAALAVFLVLFRSPLPNAIKALLPFSFFFFFEYSIVARNYGLSALLLFVVAALYRQRRQKPLAYSLALAALSWSSVLTLAPAALLIFFFFLEQLSVRPKNLRALIGLGIAVSFLLSAVLILLPYPGQAMGGLEFNGLYAGARALAFALFPIMDDLSFKPIIAWVISCGWIILFFGLLKSWRSRLLFLSSSLWALIIFLFKNAGEPRHFGLIMVTMIASWWIDKDEKGRQKISVRQTWKSSLALRLITVALIASAAYSLYFHYYYCGYLFSGSKEMAEYIKASGLEQEEIAVFYDADSASFSPYFDNKRFFLMQSGRLGKFGLFDNVWLENKESSYQERKENLLRFYRSQTPMPDSVLILMSGAPPGDSDLEVLAANSRPAISKEFYVLTRLKINQENSPKTRE